MKRLYFLIWVVSISLHSMLTGHSAIRGTETFLAGAGVKFKSFELVEFVFQSGVGVSDLDDLVNHPISGDVDDALFAAADEFAAVVLVPDEAADQVVFEHHVPAQGHDVTLIFVLRTDQDDGAGFQVAAGFGDWEGAFVHGVEFDEAGRFFAKAGDF